MSRSLGNVTLFVLASISPATSAQQAVAPHRNPPASTPAQTPAPPAAVAPEAEDGDIIWQQQCSRCHTAPSGFSPRISGTVLRHMRVRASLTPHQEEQLLHFLNP